MKRDREKGAWGAGEGRVLLIGFWDWLVCAAQVVAYK